MKMRSFCVRIYPKSSETETARPDNLRLTVDANWDVLKE